jgi:Leucine-rich repeat (LRR) protein
MNNKVYIDDDSIDDGIFITFFFMLLYISLFSLSRALNTNKFTGKMPPSLGKLSKLMWLDLADNQLSGPLPISTTDGSGLDLLLKAQHLSVL